MSDNTYLESKVEQFAKNPEFIAHQILIDLMEQVLACMDSQGLRSKDLAERLEVSRSYVTRLLEGQPNLTIRSVANIATALNCTVNISLRPDISQIDAQAELIERLGFETRRSSGHEAPESEAQAA